MYLYYMAELVHGEKEHSDWFPEWSKFCYMDRTTIKMDCSQTDITDLRS